MNKETLTKERIAKIKELYIDSYSDFSPNHYSYIIEELLEAYEAMREISKQEALEFSGMIDGELKYIERLAKLAYEAYCETTGWKSAISGADLPPYEQTPQAVKTGWMAAAKAVSDEIIFGSDFQREGPKGMSETTQSPSTPENPCLGCNGNGILVNACLYCQEGRNTQAVSVAVQPHQQRVIDEKEQLDERLMKLVAFLNTEKFAQLPVEEKGRMKYQSDIMTQYSVILGERISAFSL